ncbi:MAG TPA: cupin domain-containing protein [Anaerohalosphaeraceae bacterium]|nr:cupin domain-containing protein [Anaerohalosphaeraceae bacterium]
MPTVKDVIVRKPTAEEAKTCKTWPTWSCPVSEFEWEYTQTEKCLILEGKVTVTDNPAGGRSVSFGPGDYVVFPEGLKCIWKVTAPVRKHYDFD